jgi:hypothetical protein
MDCNLHYQWLSTVPTITVTTTYKLMFRRACCLVTQTELSKFIPLKYGSQFISEFNLFSNRLYEVKVPGIYFRSFMSPSVSLLTHGSFILLHSLSLCYPHSRGEQRGQSAWELNCGPPVCTQVPYCPMTHLEFLFLAVSSPLFTLQAFQFSVRYVLLLSSLRIPLNYYIFSTPPTPPPRPVSLTLSLYSF